MDEHEQIYDSFLRTLSDDAFWVWDHLFRTVYPDATWLHRMLDTEAEDRKQGDAGLQQVLSDL